MRRRALHCASKSSKVQLVTTNDTRILEKIVQGGESYFDC